MHHSLVSFARSTGISARMLNSTSASPVTRRSPHRSPHRPSIMRWLSCAVIAALAWQMPVGGTVAQESGAQATQAAQATRAAISGGAGNAPGDSTNSEAVPDTSPPLRWWKGNLHTHSLWSDGDDFPEMIAAWYLDNGYNFLALSDHNVLSDGQRWMARKAILDRGGPDVVSKYLQRFGAAWVEMRTDPAKGEVEVRLKPLDEFRSLVEHAGKFLMIPAEEISDSAEGKPVHMNATNLAELIKPLGGKTVREAMANNLRQVLEQERTRGREILPHLNHPNFGWAITAEDLAHVIAEQFFEIHNGHPGVNQLGDETRPSVERIWDLANAIRMLQLDADPLYGVATDDSHQYHGKPGAHTGRGWVWVQCRYLTPEHLIRAMKRGDFYASSGVTLQRVDFDAATGELALAIEPEADETYKTMFVASLKPEPAAADAVDSSDTPDTPATPAIDPARVGVVVHEVEGTEASYRLTGNELYVRAIVTSSAAPVDPSWKGQFKQAWTQPVGWTPSPRQE
jgi:hypothetical protein